MTNPKEITREEMVEAMAFAVLRLKWDASEVRALKAMNDGFWQKATRQAEAALSALNPLLERVAGGLEPFADAEANFVEATARHRPGYSPPLLRDWLSETHLRQAASLHSELKDLING